MDYFLASDRQLIGDYIVLLMQEDLDDPWSWDLNADQDDYAAVVKELVNRGIDPAKILKDVEDFLEDTKAKYARTSRTR